MESVIELCDVTKTFKKKKAIDQVSFTINPGQVTAILGPNGAGKTTTIQMMLGLLKPTSGEIKIFSKSPKEKSVRERIGAMLQEVSLMDGVKVKELLHLYTKYYPHPLEMKELINITGLTEYDLQTRTEKLSGGQKRRVSFALALAGNPDILFFDEPTVGMDVSSRQNFWEKIKEYAKQGKTIIFTTHYLQEADDYADRILLFNNGKLLMEGSPSEIKSKVTRQIVSFQIPANFPFHEFKNLPYILSVFEESGRIKIETTDSDKTIAKLFDEKVIVKDLQVEKGRLEEAFTQLTKAQ